MEVLARFLASAGVGAEQLSMDELQQLADRTQLPFALRIANDPDLVRRVLAILQLHIVDFATILRQRLLALNAKSVIAVDNSPSMVEYGKRKAQENGMPHLHFRCGNLEDPPLDNASVDVAILSQALHHADDPLRAIVSAYRILRPGGRLLILDLLKHDFSDARALYGDLWLGFDESELVQWLEGAGFESIEIETVAKEEAPPFFQTILAAALRPASA